MDVTQVVQHVRNLYLAARMAPLKADEHDQVQRSALELEKWLKTLEEKEDKKSSKRAVP